MFKSTEDLADYTLDTLLLLGLYNQSEIDHATFVQNTEVKLEFLEYYYSFSKNPEKKTKAAKIMKRYHEIRIL